MNAKLLGLSHVNFTNPNGENIVGTTLYTAFPYENVDGFKTERFFIKPEVTIPKEIKLNDTIELSFNLKGKVEKISKA